MIKKFEKIIILIQVVKNRNFDTVPNIENQLKRSKLSSVSWKSREKFVILIQNINEVAIKNLH